MGCEHGIVGMDGVREIRVALIRRGETLGSWAKAQGFSENTLRSAVYRLGCGALPRGRVIRAMLARLGKDLGLALCPPEDRG